MTAEKQVQFQTESTPTQWHVSKQNDGSYFLMQSEGRYYLNGQTDLLTVSEQPSSWWIYQTENGYVLQDAETEQVLQDSLALQDTDIETGTAFSMHPLQAPATAPLTVKQIQHRQLSNGLLPLTRTAIPLPSGMEQTLHKPHCKMTTVCKEVLSGQHFRLERIPLF